MEPSRHQDKAHEAQDEAYEAHALLTPIEIGLLAACATSSRAIHDLLWDYVIVHEILHFFVPNNGRLWKSLMQAHLGEYEGYESELKRIAHDISLQQAR